MERRATHQGIGLSNMSNSALVNSGNAVLGAMNAQINLTDQRREQQYSGGVQRQSTYNTGSRGTLGTGARIPSSNVRHNNMQQPRE